MTEMGEKLKELEEKKVLVLEDLKNNEIFIDVVLEATQKSLRTSEEEKLEYYRNAVINTAIWENPDLSEIQIFLNLVANFTVWHVKILKLFDEPTLWYSNENKQFPSFMGSLSSVLFDAYPELKSKRDLCELIWSELNRAGLTNTSELSVMMSSSGLAASRTSSFGKKFLNFIAKPSI